MRRVAEAVVAVGGLPLVFASSLLVYGTALAGEIGPDQPYGPQSDLAHLSKIYGELSLRLYAERHGFDLTLLRLGILYGPSPVEHDDPDSQTVVDKFRRLAGRGEQLPLHDDGRATIGVAHVDDAARILLATRPDGVRAEHVVAETITVADVAALAEGRRPHGAAAWSFSTPHTYQHRIAAYLRASLRDRDRSAGRSRAATPRWQGAAVDPEAQDLVDAPGLAASPEAVAGGQAW